MIQIHINTHTHNRINNNNTTSKREPDRDQGLPSIWQAVSHTAEVLAGYTQFAIQDSRLFGPNPWGNLSAAVKLPIKQRILGNPTLGTNLGQRILAMRTGCS